MNKIVSPTYLSNDKEYLMIAAVEIEGSHGRPMDSNSILGKLQHVIKAVKLWCVDNYIANNVTPQVFPLSHQACQ